MNRKQRTLLVLAIAFLLAGILNLSAIANAQTPGASPAATSDGRRTPTAEEAKELSVASGLNVTQVSVACGELTRPNAPDGAESGVGRWAFVSYCQASLQFLVSSLCWSNEPIVEQTEIYIRQGMSPTDALNEVALAQKSGDEIHIAQRYGAIEVRLDKLLQKEWAKGDVPQGVPERAPTFAEGLLKWTPADNACVDLLDQLKELGVY